MLYRHGDRSPSEVFPTSSHNETFWKDGWSQLTKKGMLQMYELGQYLRNRYDGFLDATYKRDQIRIRSSDTDRTLQSALANLAGLFPPVGEQQWNCEVPNWQPIPVHTVPQDQDILLKTKIDCSAYEVLINDQVKPILQRIDEENKEFFKYLQCYTGLKKVGIKEIGRVYGSLFRAGEALPAWSEMIWDNATNSTVYDTILELKRISKVIKLNSTEKSRFRAGYLLGDIVFRMKRHSMNCTVKEDPSKMMIYSTHDNTLLALLYSMNVSNHLIVPYAGCIMIELYKESICGGSEPTNFHVKMYFRNATNVEPYQLSLPGCRKFPCSLDEFMNLTRNSILYPEQMRSQYCAKADFEQYNT